MSFFNEPVKVIAFMAAITGLVERLIRKAGKTGLVSIQVLFVGDTACVLWSERDGNIRGTLKLPALKEGAAITRDKANRWVAYVIHEVWHVLFTDCDVWNSFARNNPALCTKIANALEDARIERSGMALGHAEGFRIVGRDLVEHMLVTGGMDVNPNHPAQIPWAFAIGCRGYNVKGERRLLSALDPRIKALLVEAKARNDAIPADVTPHTGTSAVCNIAQWVYAELQKLGKPPEPKEPQPKLPPEPDGDWPQPGDDGEGKAPKPPQRDRDDDPESDDDSEREEGDADDETYGEDEDDGTEGGTPGNDDGEGWGDTPLRVGDKVICPDGTKGVIASIEGATATVDAL